MSRHLRSIVPCILAFTLQAHPALAQHGPESTAMKAPHVASERDGQHDFDAEIGTWTTHLRRLRSPLSGSSSWVDYEGTSVVRKVMGGRANLVELTLDRPAALKSSGFASASALLRNSLS